MIAWLPKPPLKLPTRQELHAYAMQGLTLWELSKRLGIRFHHLAAHVYNTYPEYKRVASVMRHRRLEIAKQNTLLRSLRQGVVDVNSLHGLLQKRILGNAPPTYAAVAFGDHFAKVHPSLSLEVGRVDLLARVLGGEAAIEELAHTLGLGYTKAEVEAAKAVFGLPYEERRLEEWRRNTGKSMPQTLSRTDEKRRTRRSGS